MLIKVISEATITATCSFCGKTVEKKCDPRDVRLPIIPECLNDDNWGMLEVEMTKSKDELGWRRHYLVCPKCRLITARALMLADTIVKNEELILEETGTARR